jgi:hypothetical protein
LADLHVLLLFMSRNAEKQARAEAILGELAELGLLLARDLATQARACEDLEQQVALVEAFNKTSRAVRLTLALDAKLDRDAAREVREAQTHAVHTGAAKGDRVAPAGPEDPRKSKVRDLLDPLIWNEVEGDEDGYDLCLVELNERLDEASLAPDFEDLPVEVVARRIAADMGLYSEVAGSPSEPSPPAPIPADTG